MNDEDEYEEEEEEEERVEERIRLARSPSSLYRRRRGESTIIIANFVLCNRSEQWEGCFRSNLSLGRSRRV